jgi:acyl carrier protein
LGLNSLLFIKFVVRLEVEFDIDFDDENMSVGNFVTINDIVAYVEQNADVSV